MRVSIPATIVLIVSLGQLLAAQTPAPAKPNANAAVAPAVNQAPPAAPPPAGPAPAAAAVATPKPAAPTAAAPAAPPEAYTYRPDGRRDPFLSLVAGGSDSQGTTSHRGEGPSGMTLGEISVRGIMQSRGALVAMIQGPDNKTYIVHPGDKLLDGAIKTITPQGLIVIQEVNDPLSLIKQREVRKLLRSLEDAK